MRTQFLVYRIYIVSAKTWRAVPAITMVLTLSGASISLYVAGWLTTQDHASDLLKKLTLVWVWCVSLHSLRRHCVPSS